MFPILLYNNVMREIIFKIDDKNSGLMIRDFLRNFGVSSALLTKLKQDENGIKLNGKFAKAIEAGISIDFTACIVGLILPKSVLCC